MNKKFTNEKAPVLTAFHSDVAIELNISARATRMVFAAFLSFVIVVLVCVSIQDLFETRTLKVVKQQCQGEQ